MGGGKGQGKGGGGGESMQAALADEGRWVRLFGWCKALGLTEAQVRDAVVQARAEAAAAAGDGRGAGGGKGRRGRCGGKAAEGT